MTKTLILEEWSSEVADNKARGQTLADDEAKTEADIRRIQSSLQAPEDYRRLRAEMIAAGKTPSPELDAQDLKAKISHLGDIRLALELHSKNEAEIRQREGARLCLELKPSYDATARRFASSIVEAHAALMEMATLESRLRSQSIGYYPTVCNLSLQTERVFGWPTDRTSNFAALLRECVKFKHLKEMPKELA